MSTGRSVTVALDRERHLRFTFNSLCDVERSLGKTLVQAVSANIGFYELRALLWCALVHEDPALTIDAAGDAIQAYLEAGGTVADLVTTMQQALTASGLLGAVTPGVEPDSRPLASSPSSMPPSDSPSAPSDSVRGSSSS